MIADDDGWNNWQIGLTKASLFSNSLGVYCMYVSVDIPVVYFICTDKWQPAGASLSG